MVSSVSILRQFNFEGKDIRNGNTKLEDGRERRGRCGGNAVYFLSQGCRIAPPEPETVHPPQPPDNFCTKLRTALRRSTDVNLIGRRTKGKLG